MAKSTVKCKYSCCCHGGVVEKDVAVKDGNSYYHEDCFKEKNNKTQIIDIYCKRYNSNEPMTKIRKAINTLIEKNDSEYVLYALCQYVRQKKPLRSVYGISYILSNEEYVNGYKKLKANEKCKSFKSDIEIIENEENNNIQYIQKKQKTWGNLLFKQGEE